MGFGLPGQNFAPEVRRFVFVVILSLTSLPTWVRSQSFEHPNIVWIIADDLVPYVVGAYENKQVRTPNLDKLASHGMRFDRAFCNSPVCTASRQSFLTGRYPRTIGGTQLATALPDNESTLAEFLRDSGFFIEMGQFTDAGSIETNWHRFVAKDITIMGSWAFTENDLALGVRMLHHARDRYPWFEMQTLYPFDKKGVSAAVADAMAECVRLKPDVHSGHGNEQMSRIGG